MGTKATQLDTLPIGCLLGVMRDEALELRLRIDAAKAAAPYLHQKLSGVAIEAVCPEASHEAWLLTLRVIALLSYRGSCRATKWAITTAPITPKRLRVNKDHSCVSLAIYHRERFMTTFILMFRRGLGI